jgi:hypothetical protein
MLLPNLLSADIPFFSPSRSRQPYDMSQHGIIKFMCDIKEKKKVDDTAER